MKLLVLLALAVYVVADDPDIAEEDAEGEEWDLDKMGGMQEEDAEIMQRFMGGEMGGMEGMEGMDPELMAQMMGGGGMGGMGGGMGGMGGMEGMDPAMMAQMMGGGGMGGMGGMEGMDPQMMAQMMGGGMGGMGGMGGGGTFEAVFSDIKFILCPACKALIRRSVKIVEDLRTRFPNTKISEDRIDDALEGICDPHSPAGKWITEYDIIETDADTLDLKRQPKPGHCQEECMTIAAACSKIFDEFGPDVVENLWAKADKKTLTELVCNKLSKGMKGSCAKPPLIIPEDRKSQDRGFQEKSEQDIMMEEINEKIRNDPDLSSTSKEL